MDVYVRYYKEAFHAGVQIGGDILTQHPTPESGQVVYLIKGLFGVDPAFNGQFSEGSTLYFLDQLKRAQVDQESSVLKKRLPRGHV